jgi:hypothetical protein
VFIGLDTSCLGGSATPLLPLLPSSHSASLACSVGVMAGEMKRLGERVKELEAEAKTAAKSTGKMQVRRRR